jgi:hypothetical protein
LKNIFDDRAGQGAMFSFPKWLRRMTAADIYCIISCTACIVFLQSCRSSFAALKKLRRQRRIQRKISGMHIPAQTGEKYLFSFYSLKIDGQARRGCLHYPLDRCDAIRYRERILSILKRLKNSLIKGSSARSIFFISNTGEPNERRENSTRWTGSGSSA